MPRSIVIGGGPTGVAAASALVAQGSDVLMLDAGETVEPDNAALKARAAEAAKQIADGQWTIPTTIDDEKAANPFLRADVPTVAAAVGLAGKPAAEVFAEIRARKNKF